MRIGNPFRKVIDIEVANAYRDYMEADEAYEKIRLLNEIQVKNPLTYIQTELNIAAHYYHKEKLRHKYNKLMTRIIRQKVRGRPL